MNSVDEWEDRHYYGPKGEAYLWEEHIDGECCSIFRYYNDDGENDQVRVLDNNGQFVLSLWTIDGKLVTFSRLNDKDLIKGMKNDRTLRKALMQVNKEYTWEPLKYDKPIKELLDDLRKT